MKLRFLVCVGLLSVALSVAAQENGDDSIETIVIKAKKEVLDPKNTSLTTTIITSEEIEATGANNVAEVLKYVPGVVVRDSVNNQVVQIRGARYEQTLILVNGVRQSAAQNLFQDLSQYNTANVERIEVIKGSASTRYGANAAGGVINIITKDRVVDGDRTWGIEGGVRYGSYNQTTANILANIGYGTQNQGNFFVSGYIQTNAGDYLIKDNTPVGPFEGRVKNKVKLLGKLYIKCVYLL